MAVSATPTSAPSHADQRIGFQTLSQERELGELAVTGQLPPWLSGSLLRTGPARFEVGDRELRHWFDGLAMLHRFAFADGRAFYANRYLHSRAWRAAEEQGQIGFGEFASDPCRSLFKRVTTLFAPASTDNANVNISRLGEQFIAMTETPMPIAFDPRTLETAGVAYRAPGHISTAHPHHDRERGELINYAVKLGARSSYRFFAQRAGEQRTIARMAVVKPAYVHSFGLSERYLILAECPLVVDPLALALSGRPYIENYRWRPERGTRLHVFERDGGRLVRSVETDAFFSFHHVNAFERDGELVVDLIAFDDDEIVCALYLERLRAGAPVPTPQLRRHRLALDSGALALERPGEWPIELPRINYGACNGRAYRYVYGVAPAEPGGWLAQIVKVDVDDGAGSRWGEVGCYAGEPVFVAEPGAHGEDAGVLLSVVLDAGRERSFLLVLDARDLAELARAEVPHAIPFGFHGQFSDSVPV